MKPFPRTKRVAELIQHELASLLLRERSVPLLQQITITGVELTPDYAMAKIFISVFEQQNVELALTILRNMAKELRHSLAQNLNLRTTPKLNFVYDTSVDYGQKIDALLKKTINSDATNQHEQSHIEQT